MAAKTHYKIVITGPVGVGKTSAIQAVSDIEPITTDEAASDMTAARKPKTTVAMDYGVIKLESGERVRVYGTPGQERFDFMWDILTEGGMGLILLVNNNRPNPFADLDFFLNAFKLYIDQTGVVIGVTHFDEKDEPSMENYHRHLEARGLNVPVFEVDGRTKRDIRLLVASLLYSLDPGRGIRGHA